MAGTAESIVADFGRCPRGNEIHDSLDPAPLTLPYDPLRRRLRRSHLWPLLSQPGSRSALYVD
ncbi:MAG: hypothetical protein J07HQW2_00073 [Haloquadratum walsbyi J07HQW2]|uniref:Uncharacterized protein n=1 Tax=Haloquadratum walsbyi J07HQW2 TaxID=1238425 RepID=U1N9Z0_9EURY|nr:MAG: hypothetical protein J07HQW2_00073 [Haloquadratum walsbyi J07HQW2]